MVDWIAHPDKERGYTLYLPEPAPSGATVTILRNERDGMRQIHGMTEDMCEVYFEVVTFPHPQPHGKLIASQQKFLEQHAQRGDVGATQTCELFGYSASMFEFDGFLQGMDKVRRFHFVDANERTYRIVSDPRSATNADIIARMELHA